MDEEDR